jgi:hypothetical protein
MRSLIDDPGDQRVANSLGSAFRAAVAEQRAEAETSGTDACRDDEDRPEQGGIGRFVSV